MPVTRCTLLLLLLLLLPTTTMTRNANHEQPKGGGGGGNVAVAARKHVAAATALQLWGYERVGEALPFVVSAIVDVILHGVLLVMIAML